VWLFLYMVIDVWSRWFCTLTTATPWRRLLAKMGGSTVKFVPPHQWHSDQALIAATTSAAETCSIL
jgi:hypothetical protein